MKKILLIISLTILTITVVESQEKVQLGLKGGINFSNITSKSYSESNRNFGFYVGLLTEIPLHNKFSIQPEILFAIYGAEVFPKVVGESPTKTEIDLDYIQIPVIAKFYIINKLSIEIGPSFNFLINEKGNRLDLPDIVDSNGNFVRSQKYMNPYGSNFEWSAILGVSYKISKILSGSLRYTQGLSNAFTPPNYDLKAKNNSFQLGVGYLF